MQQISVILVDDQNIVRQGFRLILEQHDDIKVVGEAQSSEEAHRIIKELHPDVVVIDLASPEDNCLVATRQIKEQIPGTHIIALTSHAEGDYVLAMLKAGAEGYLLKTSAAADLVQAIRAVHQGQSVWCTEAARKLVEEINNKSSPDRHREDGLSKREEEILQLTATGATSKEIAKSLHLSAKTVDNYRSSIMEKLGARNTTEAIFQALSLGLLSSNASAVFPAARRREDGEANASL
ncbi:MAG: response regulator transcription factor [Bacteroidetes bacterium]|nr:response regulator transcription factor [Bacteroidota bacterium]MCL5026982.1 response regulator transcription factor [Chloroflexota bacterium]